MPCDTRLRKGQKISDRIDEVRRAVEKIGQRLATGQARVKVGPQGAVAFDGLAEDERSGITDACLYRRLMAGNSALAKQRIAAAEQLAGRSVNKQAIAEGWHLHGDTWHKH